MENLKTIMSHKNPDLYEWTPDFDELYYKYDGENVVADYNGKVGKLEEISTLPIFFIKKGSEPTPELSLTEKTTNCPLKNCENCVF